METCSISLHQKPDPRIRKSDSTIPPPQHRFPADPFALDPVSLPLREGEFNVDHPGIFGVFEESLPDDWGRRLLVCKHRTPLHQQNLPNLLLALGASGLGALSYTEQDRSEQLSTEVSVLYLDRLVEAAESFE
jgi:serine/threonine-protein kinase HipA